MAAGKTNFPDKNSGDKLEVNTSFNQRNHEKEKTACENKKNRRIYSSFTLFDAAFVLFSMGTYLVDMATDLWVGFHYFSSNEPIWGSLTIAFVVVPCIVMQVFSIRWHIVDDNMKGCFYWTIHFLLMGPIHRYVMVLKAGWRARMTHEPEDFDIYYHRQNDVCMLRLFESFIESAPQLLLQLYIMVYTDHTNWLTGCSASISLISLAWAIAAYTKAMRQAHQDNYRVFWPGMILQTIWRIGMVSSRVIALVMFASVYQAWLILVLGVHWLTMTIWIILQKTDFCQSWWEEKLFNCICGMIYCFCFFNLKEGQSRWRMLGFYTVMLLENGALLAAWYLFRTKERWYDQFLLGVVPVAFTIGLMCMLMYYRLCHPSGPIDPCASDISADIESTDSDDYNKPSGDPASGIIRRMTLKTTRPTCAKIEKRRSANSSFSDYSPLKDSLDNGQIGIGQSNHSENCESERGNGSDKDREASQKHFIGGTKLGFGLHGCFRPQDTVLSLVTDENFQGNGSKCSPKEDNKNRLSQNCMPGLLQEKGCGQPPDLSPDPCINLDGHEGMKMTEDKSPEVQMFSNQVNKVESQLKVSSESDGCITLRKEEITNPESKFAHDKNTSTLPHQKAEKCTVVNLSSSICNERQVTESLPPNEGPEVGVKTDVGETLVFKMPEPLPPFSGPGPVPSTKYQTFSDKLQCQGKPKELGHGSFYSKSLDTEKIPQVAQLNEVESCPKLEIALTESSKQSLPIELELCVTSENMLSNGSEIHSKTESNAPVGEKATNVRLMSSKRKSSLYSIVCTPPASPGLCKNASGKPTVVPKLIIKEGVSCNTVEPHTKRFPSRVSRNFHCSSENLLCDDKKLNRDNNVAPLTKRFYSDERLDVPGHENQLQNVVGSRCNSPAASASQLQKSRQSSTVQSLLLKNLDISVGKKVSGENDIELKLNSSNDMVGEKRNDSLSVGEGKENVKPSSSALVAGGMIKKGVAFAGEEIPRRRRTPLKDDTKFRKTRQAHQSLVAIKPETVAKALSMFGDK